MRTAIVSLALLAVVAGAVFLLTRDTKECSFSSTAIDGVVLAGGPQTADAALAGFLATGGYGQITETNPTSYERVENANGSVTFRAGNVEIGAFRQPAGWWIGSIDTSC
ncbi:MAG: hypothetical protein ACOYXM_06530 [Actinomycetota bacterium]